MTALTFYRRTISRWFGMYLSKERTSIYININALNYKLDKEHEGISEYADLSDTEPPSSAKENQALSGHAESLAKVQVRIEQQRLCLRWLSSLFVILIISGGIWMEYLILRMVLCSQFPLDDFYIILAIAPIVAVTTITVFFLHGAFRGYRQSANDSQVPLGPIAGGVTDSLMS